MATSTMVYGEIPGLIRSGISWDVLAQGRKPTRDEEGVTDDKGYRFLSSLGWES